MRFVNSSAMVIVCALACGCGDNSSDRAAREAAETAMLNAAMHNTPFISDGLDRPLLRDAASVQLPDDERVIGVLVDGEARAYSVQAMSAMTTHVVNDVVGTTPISVTYCDRSDCARTFTSETPGKGISLATGGFMNGEMQLYFDNTMYAQTSNEIPLAEHEFEMSTWTEWVTRYPDSQVFVGQTPANASSAPAAAPN